jgi:membrane dipeptidase
VKKREATGTLQSPLSRRRLLRGIAGGGALIMGAPLINIGRSRAFAADTRQYSSRAIELVGRSVVIDMLGVLAINDELLQRWSGGTGMSEIEIAEFKSSGINAFHHAFGLGGPQAYEDAVMYMAASNGLIARMSDHFARIDHAADFERIKAAGKVGVIVGLQNADQFRTVDDVKLFHSLGMRCAQLTYNEQNLIGSGCTERVDGGVSDFGSEIIAQMNQAGMLVDVSHCGDKTTLDGIELSRKPVAISHANCRALVEHPRLKTDEAIRKMAAKGGVMGVTGVRMFVRDREPTTIEHLVDHIDHVVKLVGIEHVGIGSDSDLHGFDALPAQMREQIRAGYKASYAMREKGDIEGFDHPRKMLDLTEALIRRGYSNAHIEAILGGNFQRLLAQVWIG